MDRESKTMAVAKRRSPEDLQIIPTSTKPSPAPAVTKHKKSPPPKVLVRRIPVKRGESKKAELDTTKFKKNSTLDRRTAELEEELGDVPGESYFQDKVIDWRHRILVDRSFYDDWLPKKHQGRYFMYKCIDSRLGLPKNENFNKLKGARVYGDAFVFRLEEPGFSRSGRVRYGKMESDLDQQAINNILCCLAVEPL